MEAPLQQPQQQQIQEQHDSGAGIEMVPLQLAHSDGVSVTVNVSAVPRDE